MTAHWIKVEKSTPSKPEVMQLAAILDIDEFTVVGHLVAFWCWVDTNLSQECPAAHGTIRGLDRIAGRSGFCKAMIEVGWLVFRNGEFSVPNLDRHMGKSAKMRAEDTEKKRRQRLSQDCPADSGTNVPQRTGQSRDQRREEKNNKNTNKDAGASVSGFPPEPSSGDAAVIGLETQPKPVQIPPRMQGDDVMAAARKWFRHLRQAAPERVPQPGSEQLQEWWTHYGAIGPERFVAAVDFSIARGYKNLIEEKPEHERRDVRGPAVGAATSSAQRREANNAAAFAAVFGSHPNDWPKFGHVVRREENRIHGEPAGDMGGDSQLLPG
jgi:hypothetical protein